MGSWRGSHDTRAWFRSVLIVEPVPIFKRPPIPRFHCRGFTSREARVLDKLYSRITFYRECRGAWSLIKLHEDVTRAMIFICCRRKDRGSFHLFESEDAIRSHVSAYATLQPAKVSPSFLALWNRWWFSNRRQDRAPMRISDLFRLQKGSLRQETQSTDQRWNFEINLLSSFELFRLQQVHRETFYERGIMKLYTRKGGFSLHVDEAIFRGFHFKGTRSSNFRSTHREMFH